MGEAMILSCAMYGRIAGHSSSRYQHRKDMLAEQEETVRQIGGRFQLSDNYH
jgi:hypothetical protein